MSPSRSHTPHPTREPCEGSSQPKDDGATVPSNATDPTMNDTSGVGEEPHRQQSILDAMRLQIEYYFGAQNLPRDSFLQHVLSTNQGLAPVHTIAKFPKLQALHQQLLHANGANAANGTGHESDTDLEDVVRRVLGRSDVVTVTPDGYALRPYWGYMVPAATPSSHYPPPHIVIHSGGDETNAEATARSVNEPPPYHSHYTNTAVTMDDSWCGMSRQTNLDESMSSQPYPLYHYPPLPPYYYSVTPSDPHTGRVLPPMPHLTTAAAAPASFRYHDPYHYPSYPPLAADYGAPLYHYAYHEVPSYCPTPPTTQQLYYPRDETTGLPMVQHGMVALLSPPQIVYAESLEHHSGAACAVDHVPSETRSPRDTQRAPHTTSDPLMQDDMPLSWTGPAESKGQPFDYRIHPGTVMPVATGHGPYDHPHRGQHPPHPMHFPFVSADVASGPPLKVIDHVNVAPRSSPMSVEAFGATDDAVPVLRGKSKKKGHHTKSKLRDAPKLTSEEHFPSLTAESSPANAASDKENDTAARSVVASEPSRRHKRCSKNSARAKPESAPPRGNKTLHVSLPVGQRYADIVTKKPSPKKSPSAVGMEPRAVDPQDSGAAVQPNGAVTPAACS